MNRTRTCIAALFVLLLWVPASARQATGTIDGTVKSDDGAGIGGALVKLEPLRLVEYTDQNGAFAFKDVPAGTYVVVISFGDLEARAVDVRVAAGRPTTVSKQLPRDFTVSMSTTVSAASKVQEQQLDAPVSMNVVNEKTIALEGGAGQLPSLLQTLPGAEFTQSGVYNIEFNSRGFNGALTRRVQVVVDGRDLAAPESKNQEWLSVGFLAPELESIQFVRGPAAALYGADSINGVMALTTKSPRGSPGFRATVTAGELGTFIGDARWAGSLGHGWYTRLLVDRTQSSSFAKSRTETVEYKGLPLEVAPAVVDTDATAVAARFDKYFTSGRQLVIDTGYSQSGGGTYLTQAGRVSIDDSKRSWSRVALNAAHWNVQAYTNTRNATQHALFAPVAFPTDTVQFKTEAQSNQHFAGSRGRVIVGGSYVREHVTSADSAGVQTLYQRAVTTDESALFSQVDFDLASNLKAVGALRFDASTLHTKQWSPKVALVFLPAPRHSVHVGYSRGFQVGNYTELFLRTPLAPPVDLSSIEAAFAPLTGGVALGFNSVPVTGIGNTNLKVEVVKSVEAGYVGSIGSRVKLSVDVYRNSMRDFISDLLPGINPAYPAYHAPSAIAAPVRAIIEQTVNGAIPGLTNLPDGRPQVVYSNANFGLVTSRGVEVGGSFRPRQEWSFDASYTFFDFTLENATPGLEPKPNAPRHRMGFSATYDHARVAASFSHRWVDGFTWASGAFAGPVPAYNVSDLNLLIRITPHWQAGANISNLFDRQHYEMFGGDILRRRALAHLTVNW